MQYVGKVGDYVYNQWNSLNPATLSGAIDIIVIEQPDGTLHCSPWHVRFGKFQIIKPLQKKIDLYVNDIKTDLPMKLGEGGEAFFVFETDASDLSLSIVTSPVVSAESSPSSSPQISPRPSYSNSGKNEPEELDLNMASKLTIDELESKIKLDNSPPPSGRLTVASSQLSRSGTPTLILRIAFEKAKKITQQLNIPSKIDVNGDMVLDMDGYKPNSQKNIEESDELVHEIFLKEMNSLLNGKEPQFDHNKEEEADEEYSLLQSVITKDKDGNIRIVNKDPEFGPTDSDLIDSEKLTFPLEELIEPLSAASLDTENTKTYFKTLRLTSEQLLSMKLHYGKNKLKFKLTLGTSQIVSDLYLWKSTTPIVISDIDGTITKSDALGHVLNMIGRDWTHPGVARLFQDISMNGYNILYLTARSVGQADTTRQYLDSIVQEGVKLPKGPVILSPDRTMAALRREIILKKPEVFKMACLRDIKSLFFSRLKPALEDDIEDDRTPFYAGFGNRITDAISYRSVKIPPHRIFTINPNGEVHMELLELAGYKSSYLHIGELVDQFFPPLKFISAFNNYWNEDQLNQYMERKDSDDHDVDMPPGSPRSLQTPGSPRSISSYNEEAVYRADEKFTDLNYWREPMTSFSDFSDLEDDENEPEELRSAPSSPKVHATSTPGSPASILIDPSETKLDKLLSPNQERPISATFASPLKSFMMRGSNNTQEPKTLNLPLSTENAKLQDDEYDDDDYTDDDDYDDYTEGDDDYDEEEDENDDEDENDEDENEDEDENDEEDELDQDEDVDASNAEIDVVNEAEPEDVDAEDLEETADVDAAEELDFDDDDIDEDDALPKATTTLAYTPQTAPAEKPEVVITKASDLLRKLQLHE